MKSTNRKYVSHICEQNNSCRMDGCSMGGEVYSVSWWRLYYTHTHTHTHTSLDWKMERITG